MATKTKIDWRIICTAIVAIAAIEIVALCLGYNGQLLRLVLIAIAGLAGFLIPSPLKTK